MGEFGVIAGSLLANGLDLYYSVKAARPSFSVGYTTPAATRTQIIAESAANQKFALWFKANNAAGDNYDVYIPCATLTPSGDLSLITEKDVASFELEFAVNKLSDNADLIVFTKRAA